MKMRIQFLRFVPLAAVFLSTALAAPSVAHARELKIHGSIETVEVQTPTPPTMLVQLEGTGCASHLGRFLLESESIVFLPTSFGEGTFEIDTGCGAKLIGTIAGQGYPTPDSVLVPVEGILTITSGTGRFCGASGTLLLHRVLDRSTKVSTGTIEGTVILPDPPKRRGRSCR